MSGLVYLVASGQDGLLPKIAERAYDALGKKNARVAVTYAPVAGDAPMLAFMSERMPRLFPDAQFETIDDDPSVVERADLVFVSGGDPSLGARVLDRTGAGAWLRDARARGTPLMGVSAGTIVLGEWWAAWPEDEGDDDPELARTSLVRCAGVVPGHVFDTHNEEDDWDELRIVAKLADRRGERARFVGVPTGGALVVAGDGSFEVVGAPPFYL
jgi:cyanophycinase-like exopeptidase